MMPSNARSVRFIKETREQTAELFDVFNLTLPFSCFSLAA